jgi:hypothetical protein
MENWVRVGETDDLYFELDEYSVQDVIFNNVNYKKLWIKSFNKQNPNSYRANLIYFAGTQVCTHLSKEYDNNKITQVSGKEDNPDAKCVTFGTKSIAASIFAKASAPNASTAPATTSPPSTGKRKIGGGLFGK